MLDALLKTSLAVKTASDRAAGDGQRWRAAAAEPAARCTTRLRNRRADLNPDRPAHSVLKRTPARAAEDGPPPLSHWFESWDSTFWNFFILKASFSTTGSFERTSWPIEALVGRGLHTRPFLTWPEKSG